MDDGTQLNSIFDLFVKLAQNTSEAEFASNVEELEQSAHHSPTLVESLEKFEVLMDMLEERAGNPVWQARLDKIKAIVFYYRALSIADKKFGKNLRSIAPTNPPGGFPPEWKGFEVRVVCNGSPSAGNTDLVSVVLDVRIDGEHRWRYLDRLEDCSNVG